MLLGAGHPQQVEGRDLGLSGFKPQGTRLLNSQGVSLWMEGHEPVWKQNGVWGLDDAGEPELLRPDHFSQVGERQVDFYRDYFCPFANRYAREMRSVKPDAIIFVEGIPDRGHIPWTPDDAPNVVHAAHWYDGITWFTKNYQSWMTVDMFSRKPVLGPGRVRRAFVDQIARLIKVSQEQMSGAPTLIGEVGIPFDLKGKQAYRTGDFALQVRALDATMRALEANVVSFTLWNYTADNTNARGDQWNDEDFSLFSRDQQTGSGDPYDGGRALEAAVRPYARKVAGKPLHMAFDIQRRVFEFEFQHQAHVTAPTELFVPNYQYPHGYGVAVSDGEYEIDRAAQTLTYHHGPAQAQHRITLWDKRLGSLEQVQRATRREQQIKAFLVTSGIVTAVAVLCWRLFGRRR
jgi:hypothetical protein